MGKIINVVCPNGNFEVADEVEENETGDYGFCSCGGKLVDERKGLLNA